MPWLARYPIDRMRAAWRRRGLNKRHVIFTIANHFEPAWKPSGEHDLDSQRRRVDEWHKLASKIGNEVRDADGTGFRHTNFYPAEQYDFQILEQMSAMQREGLGEVEIHLHHGVEQPDTADNLRRSLVEFRDRLVQDHKCLSRENPDSQPMYAFVHGNLALGNSHAGKFCGVDEEMQILQETGCYVDMTLPSAPVQSQVPMINQIYECGGAFDRKMPHRTGTGVSRGGRQPKLPLIFTGPLVFNWTRRIRGVPVPRIEDGSLVYNQPMDLERLERWIAADVRVKNHPSWVFVKLYCHGFFDHDQSACIGEDARRFFSEIVEHGEKSGRYSVHFASAREAFNMVCAAIDGADGEPGQFRDYRLKSIMNE